MSGLCHEHQHSFRRGRAITYQNIAKSQEHGNQCTFFKRDVSKAFDKVWHVGLEFKMI